MKALKIILAAVAVILLLGFLASWFLAENLDGFVRDQVQEVGSEQLGTEVRLESAAVSLAKGRATLAGLRVANPEGFSDEPVFMLGGIDVDIDLASVTGDVLVIEEITIRDPRVNFELNEKGVSNLDVIEERLGGSERSSAGGAKEDLLIIDRLDFRGGSITARAAARPDQELTFDFPAISMTGLGRPGGATADRIGAEISAVLVERSMSAAKQAGVQKLIDTQSERLIDKGKEKLEEKLKDILDRD